MPSSRLSGVAYRALQDVAGWASTTTPRHFHPRAAACAETRFLVIGVARTGFAGDAQGSVWQRFESLGSDRASALRTGPRVFPGRFLFASRESMVARNCEAVARTAIARPRCGDKFEQCQHHFGRVRVGTSKVSVLTQSRNRLVKVDHGDMSARATAKSKSAVISHGQGAQEQEASDEQSISRRPPVVQN